MTTSRFVLLKSQRFYCLLAILLLQACAVSEREELSDSEGIVPENFFQQIRPHKTEVSWVVDNLGEPYILTELESDTEVYTYHFQRSKVRSANALLILRYGSRQRHSDYYHLVVCDGLVRKAWWDKLERVQAHRALRKSRCVEPMKLSENTQNENQVTQDESRAHSSAMSEGSDTKTQIMNPVTTEDIKPL